ncbi:MAG: alpha/beta fold hydrolase [Bacteroidia bacterium]|nr:alpha/beta fold hydrolase [Bacteroidia bacterium]
MEEASYQIESFQLQTEDGIELSANFFPSNGPSKAAILLTPGLGVPQAYYFKYASYLSEQGYNCLTFDFRGIGEEHLKAKYADRINLRNWARQDMVAGLNWIKERFPQEDIYGIFHSIGGQIFGLVENHHLLKRVVFISAMGGYWGDEKFPVNFFTLFMWYIHIPLLTRIYGYLPKSLTYRGVAVAKGVAREWADWGKRSRYISGMLKKELSDHFYDQIDCPIDAIWFTDDELATAGTLSSVLDLYTKAPLNRLPLNPLDFGRKKIAHSGFFSSKCRDSLWEVPLKLLEGKKA